MGNGTRRGRFGERRSQRTSDRRIECGERNPREAGSFNASYSLSLGLKVVFLALTSAGLATLWMAVAADMGASLLVIANGLRLLRYD